MRLRIFHKIMLFTGMLATGSCLESFEPPAITKEYNYLVVGGFLISGLEDSTVVSLSRTQTIYSSSVYAMEYNAVVKIEDEQGNAYVLREHGNGKYSLPPTNFDHSKNYRLHILTHNAREYTSDFVPILSSSKLDNVSWKEVPNNIQITLTTHDLENKTRYYLWNYDETWKYSSFDYSKYVIKNGKVEPRGSSSELYYCWRTNASNQIYIHTTKALSENVLENFPLVLIPDNDVKLYYEYSMLVKQHALSADAYAYWLTLKKNTESLGTLFDPIPSQLRGNLHSVKDPDEPVIGYFSATTLSKKRISLVRQQLTGSRRPYTETGYENCTSTVVPLKDVANASGLIIGDVYDLVTQQLTGYSMAPTYCIDCRSAGGVTARPDFWE
jgi:hypothetical protein